MVQSSMTMPPPLPAVTSNGHVVNDTALALPQVRRLSCRQEQRRFSSGVATQPIRRAADPPPLLTSSGATLTMIRVGTASQPCEDAYVVTRDAD